MILPPARLRIVLERPDRRYAPGEVVRGRVDVEATSAFTFDRLVVELRWATRGKGSVDSGATSEIVHGEGSCAPGRWSLPFQIALDPAAMRTCHGVLVSLDWAVAARLEVPRAVDPETAQGIVVVAPPTAPARTEHALSALAVHPPSAREPAFERAHGGGVAMSSGASAAFGGVLSAGGIGWLVAHGFDLVANGAVLAAFVSLFGGYMVWTSVRRMWTRAAVRRLELYVGPCAAPPIFARGEPVACLVRVATAGSVRVRRVVFALLARERARYSSDGREKSATHDHEWGAREVLEPHVRAPREPGYRGAPDDDVACVLDTLPPPERDAREYRAILAVPRDAPPTLQTEHNSVRWLLRVLVELDGAPDWDEVHELYERV